MKGEPWKELHGFMCYIVTLKGGPADGMKTIAGNTQTVYFAGTDSTRTAFSNTPRSATKT